MELEKDLSWIESVKEQGSDGEVTGYLVNGSLSIPIADSNRHYKDIKIWLESNTPEPEFTQQELDISAQEEINSTARAYLASTDWYITRQQETGVEIPVEVSEKRAEARSSIKDLNNG